MKKNGAEMLGLGVNRKGLTQIVSAIVCTAGKKVAKVVRVRSRIVP